VAVDCWRSIFGSCLLAVVCVARAPSPAQGQVSLCRESALGLDLRVERGWYRQRALQVAGRLVELADVSEAIEPKQIVRQRGQGKLNRDFRQTTALKTVAVRDVLSGCRTLVQPVLGGEGMFSSRRAAQFVTHSQQPGIAGRKELIGGKISSHLTGQVAVGNVGLDAAHFHLLQVCQARKSGVREHAAGRLLAFFADRIDQR
jgi:hypothetical protein